MSRTLPRYALAIVAATTLFAVNAPHLFAISSANLQKYQQSVLAYCNYARTNPQQFARKYLLEYANNPSETGGDNGSYQDLMKRSAVGALKLNSKLSAAAQGIAAYMATNNVFDHNADGRTPFVRIKAAGYQYRYAGENIACGSYDEQDASSDPDGAALAFVLQWIIDDGVQGVGHRLNILSPNFTEIGVGFARNTDADYVNYTVQDFGSPVQTSSSGSGSAGTSGSTSSQAQTKVIRSEDRIKLDFSASDHVKEYRCGAGIWFSSPSRASAKIFVYSTKTNKIVHTYETAKPVAAGDNWYVCLWEWESAGKTVDIAGGDYKIRVLISYAGGKVDTLETSEFTVDTSAQQ